MFKSFPDFCSVCFHLPPQPFSPLKMGRTLHLTSQRLRRECETKLKKQIVFGGKLSPVAWNSPFCTKLKNLNTYGDISSEASIHLSLLSAQTGQTLLLWLRWYSRGYSQASPKLGWDEDDIYCCLLPAPWARQTGDITGLQRAITKVPSGHTSCICMHAAIQELCRVCLTFWSTLNQARGFCKPSNCGGGRSREDWHFYIGNKSYFMKKHVEVKLPVAVLITIYDT